MELQLELVLHALRGDNLYPLPPDWIPRALVAVDRFNMVDGDLVAKGLDNIPASTLQNWLRWKQLLRQLFRKVPALEAALK